MKLPTNIEICYHCFVPSSNIGQIQEIIKENKQNYKMMLFCNNILLSIEYDEEKKCQCYELHVSNDVKSLNVYLYLKIVKKEIKDIIKYLTITTKINFNSQLKVDNITSCWSRAMILTLNILYKFYSNFFFYQKKTNKTYN
ncbi:hypothetical protein RFI_39564, partial [Reticulomyxa filosa]